LAAPKRGPRTSGLTGGLTHLDETGRARMVDVGDKPETARVAIAEARVSMSPATLALVAAGSGKKGDVIATARLAGIAALKRTAELIPLCHPVRVVGSDVTLTIEDDGVRIEAQVSAFDRTGVEMEAMVAAGVAALTVYDMVKGVERGVTITGVRLLEKRGGRSGVWRAEDVGKRGASGGKSGRG
jgi:cyclic pyranopterin phosphate synthase